MSILEIIKSIFTKQIIFSYAGKRTRRVFVWKPFVTMKNWMEEHIILTMSARNGKFQTKYKPHAIGIFEDIDKSGVQKVTLKSSSQVIKTTIGIGFILKYIDTDANNSMIMIPNESGRTNYSENILKPKIEGCPTVKKKLMDYQIAEKTRSNSFIYRFAGGLLNLKGSNDPKSISVKYALFDEVSDFARGKVGEALERMKTYIEAGGKALIVSTQEHENDEINFYFNNSEVKKQYFMHCIYCKEHYYPEIIHLKYPTEKEYGKTIGIERELEPYETIGDYLPYARERATLQCPHCEKHMDNEQRRRAILDGKTKWVQVIAIKTEESIIYKIAENPKETYKTVGFDINTLCIDDVPLSELVEKIVAAKVSADEETDLDFFYRGYLNRIYKREFHEAEQSDMLLLGNNTKEWVVPKDTVKIYLTIDNQIDYLFAQVTAVGYGVVSHIMFFGRIETWNDAEEMWDFCQYLEDEDGNTFMVSKMGVDRRGYNEGQVSRTDEADVFVNYMTQKWGEDRIYGMEGHPDRPGGRAFDVVNHKDYSDQRNEVRVKIIKFSNIYLKRQLFRSIERTILKAKAKNEDDAAFNYTGKLFYINQDNIDRDSKETTSLSLTKMLTAEVLDYAKNKKTGKIALVKSWVPIRKRNDAIDTSTMALTLSDMDKIILMKKPTGESLVKALESLKDLDFS